MKNIFKYLTLSVVAVLSITGCHERYVTYSDAEYVMFADTLAVYPVQNPDSTFRIPVVSTVKRDYDRTFGVEVIDKGNNAIEKKHYRLESNTVTIKAGEYRADVLVHGYYSNLEDTDSLGFELQLVMDERLEMSLYGKNTKAVLMKSCPFNVDDFTGYCLFTSMFLYQYSTTGAYQRLIETEKVNENTIRCKNWLKDGYDIIMTFETGDPMKPYVKIPADQVASDEGSSFGTSYGDDRILVSHSSMAESIYYPCGKYLYVWSHMYVENLGVAIGTVGHFYNVMEWISEEEAMRLKKEEGM